VVSTFVYLAAVSSLARFKEKIDAIFQARPWRIEEKRYTRMMALKKEPPGDSGDLKAAAVIQAEPTPCELANQPMVIGCRAISVAAGCTVTNRG
jgi:hypothetical protein